MAAKQALAALCCLILIGACASRGPYVEPTIPEAPPPSGAMMGDWTEATRRWDRLEPGGSATCDEAFVLRTQSCDVGGVSCSTKGSALTHAELDSNQRNIMDLCRRIDAIILPDGGVTSLTCGATGQGQAQVMDDGDLEWCDGAATSSLQSVDSKIAAQDHTDHGDGANCAAGEIPLGVDADGAVQGCYEPSEADITDLTHTTDTGPSPDCSGTTTYQDGEGDCDDLSTVYCNQAGCTVTGAYDFNDGVGNSPSLLFTPQTGIAWTFFAQDSDDDLIIRSSTSASSEQVVMTNPGAGDVNLSIEGTITQAGNNVCDDGSVCTGYEADTHASEHESGGADTLDVANLTTTGGTDKYVLQQTGASTYEFDWPRARSHATDCTSLTDGEEGDFCWEIDDNTFYVCEPSAGLCDTAGEWAAATAAGDGVGYDTIEDNDAAETKRAILNLISGGTVTVSCADDAGNSETDCTFTGSAHFTPTAGIDTDHGAGAIDQTTDFAGGLCGTGEYLVDDGASWSCDPVVIPFSPTAGISTDHGAGAVSATADLAAALCGSSEILEDQGASWACIPTPTGTFTSFDITDTDASPILTVDNGEQIQYIGAGTVTVTAAADASNHDVTITGSAHVPEAADYSNLTGGAGIVNSPTGTIATASGETDFLAGGALTCGAGTAGRMRIHTTPIQYCDNAATPVLRYGAYGASDGDALTGDSATAFFDAGQIESARGGTGIDTSVSTGVPRVAAGTWSADATLEHLGASTGQIDDDDLVAGAVDGGSGGEIADGTVDGEDMAASYAGRSLTEVAGSPDTLDVDAEIYTGGFSFVLESPVAGDSGEVQTEAWNNITITQVRCSTDTGTATININERAETTPNTTGTDVLSAGLVCDTNSQDSCSSGCDVNTITNATIDQNDPMALEIDGVSVAPAPGWVRVHVRYTKDD